MVLYPEPRLVLTNTLAACSPGFIPDQTWIAQGFHDADGEHTKSNSNSAIELGIAYSQELVPP